MSNKKEEKALRRKHRKEKEDQRQGDKEHPTAMIYRVMNCEAQLYGCWINQDWKTAGIACVIVARKMNTGLLMMVIFWLDMVKHRIDNCFGAVNLTEEAFQRNVLQKEKKIEFFNASLDLVKEVIATVVREIQKKEEELPENYFNCIRLVGSLDKYLTQEEAQPSRPIAQVAQWPQIVYTALNPESVETELFQLSMLQEAEDSMPGQRRFNWYDNKRRSLLSKEITPLANLILEGTTLTVEVMEQSQMEHIKNSLLQYLGTSIALQEKRI
jgi:hypothetical protein